MKHRILSSLLLLAALSLALTLILVACDSGQGEYVPPTGSVQQPDSSALPDASDPAVTIPVLPPAQDNTPPSPSAPEIQLPPQNDPAPVSPEPVPATPEPVPSASARPLTMEQVYRAALETIYSDHRYPNGDEVATGEGFQMEGNDFAIYDVDGDGREELIYQNDNSYMAGMITTVYGFDPDTGKLYQELDGFVAMTFYDNGVVNIPSSHNQGLGQMEDFWPYALYQYDPGSDGYLMAASVDGWDGTFFPNDREGNPFPTDIDQDGDKAVYILISPGQEVTTTTIDGPEYQQWLDSYLAGASELELPWQSMTPENIRAVAP